MTAAHSLKTLVLKISLLASDPVIWRQIWIPESFDFYQLHLAIQAAFGWQNSHLFNFSKGRLSDEYRIGIPDEEYPLADAKKVKLKKIFRNPGDSFAYIYDFGDYWHHVIELEAINNQPVYSAICEKGANECPPEDVGGLSGYQQMVKTFQSGTEPEKQEYRDWLGLSKKENWHFDHYSQREVNKRMSLLYPASQTF